MSRHLALAASLVFAAVPLRATTYTIEPDYTQAVFRWSHLGFSSPAAQVSQGQGTLEFDPVDPTRAAVKVTFGLAGLSSGVPALDEHLRSEDFFEVSKFPTATFRSKVGANPRTQLPTVGVEATTTLKRSEFGLGAYVPQVGDEIRLQLTSQGVEAKGYAEYLKKQEEKK